MDIRRSSLALLTALTLALPSLAQELTPDMKVRTLVALQQTIVRRAFVPGVDFSKLPVALARHQAEIDAAPDSRAFALAVNAALRDFGVSHIRFQTPAAVRQRATGEAVGFGLAAAPGEGGLTVTTLAPGSPAAKVGLAEGDSILEVEGRKASTPADIEQAGRETSLLTVRSKADGRTHYVMLVRKAFSTDRAPTLTWPAPGVARLALPNFTRSYDPPKIERMLADAARARTLILDLRGNGGGAVVKSTHLLSLLLPPGTPIGVSVTKDLAAEYAKSTGSDPSDPVAVAKWKGATRRTARGKIAPFEGKIVVLLDRRSASASEIVSSVLREERGAAVVGQPSAGAVLTSIYARLTDGYEVQLPISDFVTPKGIRLEKNPIQPDVAVSGAAKDEAADPVVQAALARASE